MSRLRLILNSLTFHWRINLAVACGVAVGSAVLTGALLVGDSMRGSLRDLTLDRLGRIDDALVPDRFFRAALADELPPVAVPTILLRVSLQSADPQSPAQANHVQLIGCDQRFWPLDSAALRLLPRPHEIVLNQPLAEQLGVAAGHTVLLRLPRPNPIPAESPLGRKQDTIRTQRLTVSEVIAAKGLGRFGLQPTQRLPRNAYVPLQWLQEQLQQPGRANVILVADQGNNAAATIWPQPTDHPRWRPQLADYGLNVQRTPLGYWNITSDRMLHDAAAEQAIFNALPNRSTSQSALTYLINTIACNGREIPYSTITAIDFADRPPLGPFLSAAGKPLPPLGPNQIALNSWAAAELHAKPGDTIRLTYFEPENIDGKVNEKTVALRLASVVKLSGAADDRALVPTVKGVTDELTMREWDPPFPFDIRRIRPNDDAYWDRHGPTPKAFVSLATGRQLWGSRFGQTTSIRVSLDRDEAPCDDLLQERLNPTMMGFVLQPVKQQGLTAAAGTTPFDVLFLCFSFFIIAAAVMLVAILFRLGVEQRATQVGTLLAVGLSRRQVGRLLLGEGLVVAAVGSLVGVPLAAGYAALLLLGLRTLWLAAVVTPFLRLHVTAASLTIGSVSGLGIALAVIWLSVRSLGRLPPCRLLTGQTTTDSPWHRRRSRRIWTVRLIESALVVVALAPSLVLLLKQPSSQIRIAAFFISGAIALIALLALVWICLKEGMTGPAVAASHGNLVRMALRNAARNPVRSTLTIGLVAAASFLIVAVSAFHIDPSAKTPALHSGDGGFVLIAETDQPIFSDLNTPEGRKALGFPKEDERLLSGCKIVSLRVRAGDDASCLNLYRPRQPRLLGVPLAFIEHDGFVWADRPHAAVNPWNLLNSRNTKPPTEVARQVAPTGSGVAENGIPREPVILEKNTANYSLNLWGGLGETFEVALQPGHPRQFQVVALLANSIFQGDLLISEQAFLRQFPSTSGYRFFLIDTLPEHSAAVRKSFARNLGDYGLAIETTSRRLTDFITVQNTYLSTFQSLGGLGLLLGTFGLAAVQVRSVFERRGELALLRAVGFRRSTLARLVLLEHTVVLVAGLGIGLAAATLAVLPHLLDRGVLLPWISLAGTFAAVLTLGLAVGGIAVRAALRAPLLTCLRERNR